MYENRRWLVIPTDIVETIDFNEVMERDINTLRYSIDGSKTFVKYNVNVVDEEYVEEYYDAEDPSIVYTNTFVVGVYGRPSFYSEEYQEYNHEEILELLRSPEWNPSNDIQ